MSGKGAGKKRNRAAQSSQHGYQELPEEAASKPGSGEAGGTTLEGKGERQRVLEKLRELEESRKGQESR